MKDRDGTGYVKISEMKKFTHRLGQPLDDERVHAIFDSMDKNRDGKINFDDFMEWFSDEETRRGIKAYFRQKTIQIFNEIDIKNHGYLDEEEKGIYQSSSDNIYLIERSNKFL